jgi:hypothetical protein
VIIDNFYKIGEHKMKITRKELREIIEEVATELGVFEGNAFGDAVRKAKEAGDDEFEVDGKTFKVKEALTKKQEKLPEPLKKAILKKQGETVDEEEETIEEGNAWGNAVRKAKEEQLEEFEFNGKTYQVMESAEEIVEEDEDTEEFLGDDDDDVEEGNAFGDAVRKAKEAGEDEFEVDGKTFKVTEVDERGIRSFAESTLSETFSRITGNKKVISG